MENPNLDHMSTPALASASVSPSTSDGNSINHCYDVFINCRGPDVGKTLASHLYHSLRSHGLRVFQETEELEMGDGIPSQIYEAIAGAYVNIAIFSPTYAESAWCLRTLHLMCESSSTILPVFYGVNPSDLRWMGHGNGPYARALHRFDKMARYDSYTIAKWTKALCEVADINGFVLEDCNRDEARLVNNIVERVLKKFKNHLSYNVFINHRGDDVKKNLASHLYYGLIAHGLRVFLDIEEMRQGDGLNYQIERAIETAFVHIAIFSPKYAESEWCLNELVDMFKSGKTIIPVFKGVRPSELGLENGRYAKDLCKLKEKITVDPQTKRGKPRFDNDTLENWRFYLSRVAQVAEKRGSDLEEWDGGEGKVISGFDLEECDGDEGQLVDQVVKRVLEEEAKRVLEEEAKRFR